MMKHFAKEFPVLNQYTYLNTASSGLLSESLLTWRQEHDLDYLIGGSLFRERRHQFLKGVKETVASFFYAKSKNIALIPNFSLGFNMLLEGLSKRQNVLLLENDYPSVNWAVENRDFEVFYVKIDEYLEANIAESVAKHQPCVFAFSIIQYNNGIKIDLDFIKKLKNDYPELLIIADGTQYCGTEVFDFENSGIDVLGASAYKWLLGGYGNGFMIFKDEAIPKIHPKTLGFNSTHTTFSKAPLHITDYFEPGHQDTLAYGSMQFSLRFLQQMGLAHIEQQLHNISEKAKTAFTELGLLEASVVNRKKHSSIFNIKGNDTLFSVLRSKGIISSQKGNGIRVSFHFYNTEKDIAKMISVLKTIKQL